MKRGFKLETRAYSSCALILKDVQVLKLMRQLFVKCSWCPSLSFQKFIFSLFFVKQICSVSPALVWNNFQSIYTIFWHNTLEQSRWLLMLFRWLKYGLRVHLLYLHAHYIRNHIPKLILFNTILSLDFPMGEKLCIDLSWCTHQLIHLWNDEWQIHISVQ